MDESSPGEGVQDSQKVTDSEQTDALTVAGAALSAAVSRLMKEVAKRGKVELSRAASQGRVMVEMRQLRRDRAKMFEKLGREVVHLVDGGEIKHPGLIRGVKRIQELDCQISNLEALSVQEGIGGSQKNLDDAGDDL